MKIAAIRERFPHMGAHSGYDCLFNLLADQYQDLQFQAVWKEEKRKGRFNKAVTSRLMKYSHGSKYYTINSYWAEVQALMKLFLLKPEVFHIAYLENNFGLGSHYSGFKNTRKMATIHQPTSWWKIESNLISELKALDNIIVLDTRSQEFFSHYYDANKIHVIPHGVDTTFFVPANNSVDEKEVINCLFCGQWFRDLHMLNEIISSLNQISIKPYRINFNLVIPDKGFSDTLFYKLAAHQNVFWHRNLSDQALLALYQFSDVLVLPLIDSTANNTVLEAMACGLPIVSTNKGGIADYVKDDFAFLSNSPNDLVDYIKHMVHNQMLIMEKGRLARVHAVEKFDWMHIAERTHSLYLRR